MTTKRPLQFKVCDILQHTNCLKKKQSNVPLVSFTNKIYQWTKYNFITRSQKRTHYQNVKVVSNDIRKGSGHDLVHWHAVEAVKNPLGFLGGLCLVIFNLHLPFCHRLFRRSSSFLLYRCHSYNSEVMYNNYNYKGSEEDFPPSSPLSLFDNVHTWRWSSRLSVLLKAQLWLLYCVLMLWLIQDHRTRLLLPDVLLVCCIVVIVWGWRVVLVVRVLIRRWLPVDRQLRHNRLISGTFCVMAHVVIWHHILGLWVLLTGLVPRKYRRM